MVSQKKKAYEGHEIAYQWMKKKGLKAWGQKGSRTTGTSCDKDTTSFISDILRQKWVAGEGKIIELGCGTGPLLRWVCQKGYRGVGIDTSKTAIAMAKEQSKGLGIRYKQGDVCNLDTTKLGAFDIVLDGLCLHCITETEDRKKYFQTVHRLLKDDGVFIVLTMCGPVDRKLYRESFPTQPLKGKVIYVPFSKGEEYQDVISIGERLHLPSRYIGHYNDILREVKRNGFAVKLMRYKASNDEDCMGTLCLGLCKGEDLI